MITNPKQNSELHPPISISWGFLFYITLLCEMMVWNVVLKLMFLIIIYFCGYYACKISHYSFQKYLQFVIYHRTQSWLRVYLNIIFLLVFSSLMQAITEYHYALKSKYWYLNINVRIISSNFDVLFDEESITYMYLYIQCNIPILFLFYPIDHFITFGSIISLYSTLL